MAMRWFRWVAFGWLACQAGVALAQSVSFKDPTGDDDGPGTYVYPTDAVYAPGSFDLTGFSVEVKGSDAVFTVEFRTRIGDPWDSKSWSPPGNGFSLQFVQVYIDQDHKSGSGFRDALPGINARFRPESAWEKVVLISPQGRQRLESEVATKAGPLKTGVVIPKSVRVQGRSLVATVPLKDLGGAPAGWGYGVLVQSNEGYPSAKDLLTRKVNEIAGAHRFGGGSDWDCDPHVIDLLVAPGKGGADEVKTQHEALKYQCDPANPEGSPLVEIPMIYP